MLDDFRGNAAHYCVGWNVAGNYRTGGYDGVSADRHSFKNSGAGRYPNIVFDDNWSRLAVRKVIFNVVEVTIEDDGVRSNTDIVADNYRLAGIDMNAIEPGIGAYDQLSALACVQFGLNNTRPDTDLIPENHPSLVSNRGTAINRYISAELAASQVEFCS